MSANSFGKAFKITTFGESHGFAMGGVIDGCPPNLTLDLNFINKEIARRKPAGAFWATPRDEDDEVIWLSGLTNNVTNGAPLAFMIKNQNIKKQDYTILSSAYRPSHGDFTWEQKFQTPPTTGGGRLSARETVVRVVAGAIAKQWLQKFGIEITGWTQSIGSISIPEEITIDKVEISASPLHCPHEPTRARIETLLKEIVEQGDSVGGVIKCLIEGVPIGLGEPVFDKTEALLSHAMLSIPAVKGFEIGSGFAGTKMKGSQHNDLFTLEDGKITTSTNNAGGVLGGITNGNSIDLCVAFKPVSTIKLPQLTIDRDGKETTLEASGRHDACVVPRAIVVVEAMAALVMADLILRHKQPFASPSLPLRSFSI